MKLILNPLNIMLLVLAAINFIFLEDFESGFIVSLMVVLSVTLSFVQEHRSNHAAEKLRAMVSNYAHPSCAARLPRRRAKQQAGPCACSAAHGNSFGR